MNNNHPLMTLEGLAIGYEGEPVLSGISLSVERGSFTAVLGANGSGKSTLLKTILGLQNPLAGTLLVDRSLVFGYVPQAALLDSLYLFTGLEVALMGVYGRVSPGRFVPASERDFTRECLRATGAETFAGQPFSELSGGQKQRVLIARALAAKPDLLALDEPTAGVDVAGARAVFELLSRLHQELGLTILIVTHDWLLVRKHARHVIWLHQGKVLLGPAAELLSRESIAGILEMEF